MPTSYKVSLHHESHRTHLERKQTRKTPASLRRLHRRATREREVAGGKEMAIVGKTIHLHRVWGRTRPRKNCYLNHKISCGYTNGRVNERARTRKTMLHTHHSKEKDRERKRKKKRERERASSPTICADHERRLAYPGDRRKSAPE